MPWIVAFVFGVFLVSTYIQQQNAGKTLEDTAYCRMTASEIANPAEKAMAMADCQKALGAKRQQVKSHP
ncbi:hypothetical protein M2352_002713 [Azospirillum fermentarium]|uniref:hypothetical protein n=1 Tax=Azospirillum fermentarium TaxID=1233114 RepID=UPI0022278E46|nr:hypothetical protein [Azospirillum fermentarium]MCW2247122.1 hypothetical protein [Azospirillum fermentarium]